MGQHSDDRTNMLHETLFLYAAFQHSKPFPLPSDRVSARQLRYLEAVFLRGPSFLLLAPLFHSRSLSLGQPNHSTRHHHGAFQVHRVTVRGHLQTYHCIEGSPVHEQICCRLDQ